MMIVNPSQQHYTLRAFFGTRLLENDFGLVGTAIQDPIEENRVWTIQNIFKPLPRCIGGIRARCLDQKGFVSFIDQLSFEVLLGLGIPGRDCEWADRTYPAPGDRNWLGFCVDSLDMVDDLYIRESLLRIDQPVLPQGMEMTRCVHVDDGQDVQDLMLLLWDGDPETGMCPDIRLETIERRWARVQRERVKWSRILV
jgi:hypothetical protein